MFISSARNIKGDILFNAFVNDIVNISPTAKCIVYNAYTSIFSNYDR